MLNTQKYIYVLEYKTEPCGLLGTFFSLFISFDI